MVVSGSIATGFLKIARKNPRWGRGGGDGISFHRQSSRGGIELCRALLLFFYTFKLYTFLPSNPSFALHIPPRISIQVYICTIDR